MRIAVDAMGGDHAPRVVVEGALSAAGELGVEIVLVGLQPALERELARHAPKTSSITIVPASEVVGMDESPSVALKKRDSSMTVAFELMKRNEVSAVVSAGNSGAFMATGMFVLGNLLRVERPAILVVVPTPGKGTVIIDAGANVECKQRHLVQFALMGSIYAERVLGIPRPRVGVLSNGAEEGKGTDLTRAVREQLSSTPLHCIGYVEGRDISSGGVDVVVTDGFTGNVTLKTMEGVASFVVQTLKEAFRQSFLSRLGLLLCRGALRTAFSRLDYAEYGGAPLLGLEGVTIIAHGGSNPKAIKNAIRMAREAVTHDVNQHIVKALEDQPELWGERGENVTRKIWKRFQSKIGSLGGSPSVPGERDDKDEGKG